MQTDTKDATARLPLVGEAARPTERRVLAAGQDPAPAADSRDSVSNSVRAPIIALHGVGDFAPGDVIGEIARDPAFSRCDDFRRETVFASNYRFSLLVEGRPATVGAIRPGCSKSIGLRCGVPCPTWPGCCATSWRCCSR